MRKSTVMREREVEGDSFGRYLREIKAYPLLSRDEEVALAERIQQGDTSALDQLVCANLRFVVSIAKRYQGLGLPMADLVNEGNLGLIHAAEKFDASKGVKFISYAVWWIRQAMVQTLAEQGHPVRVPVNRAGRLYRMQRRASALRQELGREPTHDEVAMGLGVSVTDVEVTLPLARSQLSLDATLGDEDEATMLDYLADDAVAAPDLEATEGDAVDCVAVALAHLRSREAQVIRMYFGFDGSEPMTLEAIGAVLGVTRERVRQLKQRGLMRLRRSSDGAALQSLHTR